MLKKTETIQKATEKARGNLDEKNGVVFGRQGVLERIVEQVMADRPDLANDIEALADEALRRMPELVKHLEER